MSKLFTYKHHVIDDAPLGDRHPNCAVGDLTGNGKLEVIIGSHAFPEYVHGRPEYLVYYEYVDSKWNRKIIDNTRTYHLGLTTADVNGNGRTDILAALDAPCELVWYENTGNPDNRFIRHTIDPYVTHFVHDLLWDDIDGDGKPELIMTSPFKFKCYYKPGPDITQPWNRHLMDNNEGTEGLCVWDFDNNGLPDLFSGPRCFVNPGPVITTNPPWVSFEVAKGYHEACRTSRISLPNGKEGLLVVESEIVDGRISWFEYDPKNPREFIEHPIDKGIYYGHSIAVADIDGDGENEIFVGEMIHGCWPEANEDAKLMIYKCRDVEKNIWDKHVFSEGIGTHEAKLCDLMGDGKPHIVGKSWQRKHVDWWEPQW